MIHSSGWIWSAFLFATFSTTYDTKPAPMPAEIEYVNGISTIVRNAGMRDLEIASS